MASETEARYYGPLTSEWTRTFELGGIHANVTTAPPDESIYMGFAVKGATNLAARANLNIHSVTNFGGSFAHMRGKFEDTHGFFEHRYTRPDLLTKRGVYILADQDSEAKRLSAEINGASQSIIEQTVGFREDDVLFQKWLEDTGMGKEVLDLYAETYDLERKLVPRTENPKDVAVLRTGGVTRNLSIGIQHGTQEWEERPPSFIDINAKRGHPGHEIFGAEHDMWSMIRMVDRDQLAMLHDANVEMADGANATGASIGGIVFLGLTSDSEEFPEGIRPAMLDQRFIFGTLGSTALWTPVYEELGIPARSVMLDAADEQNDLFYLSGKDGQPFAIEDAGDLTEFALPGYAAVNALV